MDEQVWRGAILRTPKPRFFPSLYFCIPCPNFAIGFYDFSSVLNSYSPILLSSQFSKTHTFNTLTMASPQQIKTTVTDLLGIKHPILLAGMGGASGSKLAAAVSNAGGMGVIGGNGYTPTMLRNEIAELKSYLHDKSAPFGVDLLIPQIGGNARKTNSDYNKGKLNELIEVIIEAGAKLFVCAIGIPPQEVVDKLHRNGLLYMNMVGHPKHVQKALDRGADLICAQGGEGGGHTGDVPLSVLIPEVVRLCDKKTSSHTGKPVQVIAAGGISNGQTLSASLMLGASAVWVGTRFVLSEESNASRQHQEAVRTAGFDDNIRTIIFSGRPLRVRNNPYINDWETNSMSIPDSDMI